MVVHGRVLSDDVRMTLFSTVGNVQCRGLKIVMCFVMIKLQS